MYLTFFISIIIVSFMPWYFLVVPVWIESIFYLRHLALYAHHRKTTPALCGRKFKNQQYLKIEFLLSFRRYIIRLWTYYQSENGRPDLSPTFLSSFMNPVFVCTNGVHGENPFIPMNESICVQMSTFICKWMYLHNKHLPTCHTNLGFSTFSAWVLRSREWIEE